MRGLLRAVGDLLTPRFLLLSLLPLLVVVPLLGVAAGALAGGLGEVWRGDAGSGWLIEAFAGVPWLGGLTEFGWFRGLLGVVGEVAGWLLLLLAALFLAVAVVGFLTPSIVAEVRRRHYPEVTLRGFGGVGAYLLMLLRTLLVFALLWLLVLPLLFVPLVNVLAINLPFFYWFHRLLVWDVASAVHDLPAYRRLGGPARAGLLLRTAALYPLSLLPLVGLLLQVAFVLVLAHYLLARAERDAGGAPGATR